MAQVCERCRTNLYLRHAYMWYSRCVCHSCLKDMEAGRKWFEHPFRPALASPRKIPILAGLLALLFGPFGMLYVGMFWKPLVSEILFYAVLITALVTTPEGEVLLVSVAGILGIGHSFLLPGWAMRRAKDINAGECESLDCDS